jgi:cyclopropane-fatty-acyl-phospholipid synthase
MARFSASKEAIVSEVALSAATRRPRRLGRRACAMLSQFERVDAQCEIVLPNGEVVACGAGPPAFRLIFRSDAALARLDEFSLASAYVEGLIDLEGDPLALLDARRALRDRTPVLQSLTFLAQLFLAAPTLVNRKAIAYHYTLGDDFYLSFIDRRYRFYSHCLFRHPTDTLEDAAEYKLESMWDALELRPGMRLLDIGAGWGGVAEYCGPRGVHVTSVTLVQDSYNYVRKLLADRHLPGEVVLGDFLEHRPERPYDAAVIYGVIEHFPYYRRFCSQVWECLTKGGRIYVDASASKWKFAMSAFTRRYTWHGTHTFLSLQDLLQEFLLNGFKIRSVAHETRDYELTILEWARRFDAAHDAIAARWGEQVWRSFRVFLWGGGHAFRTDGLQAYHLVAERGADRGPRPGGIRRTWYFVRGLAS